MFSPLFLCLVIQMQVCCGKLCPAQPLVCNPTFTEDLSSTKVSGSVQYQWMTFILHRISHQLEIDYTIDKTLLHSYTLLFWKVLRLLSFQTLCLLHLLFIHALFCDLNI